MKRHVDLTLDETVLEEFSSYVGKGDRSSVISDMMREYCDKKKIREVKTRDIKKTGDDYIKEDILLYLKKQRISSWRDCQEYLTEEILRNFFRECPELYYRFPYEETKTYICNHFKDEKKKIDLENQKKMQAELKAGTLW